MLQIVKDKFANIRDRIALRSSYERVFDTPDGQRVIRHMMRVGFMTRSTFVSGDSHETALNEGSRRLALSILRFIGKDQAEIQKLVEENLKDES